MNLIMSPTGNEITKIVSTRISGTKQRQTIAKEPLGVSTAEKLFKEIFENNAAAENIELSSFPFKLVRHIKRLGLSAEQLFSLINAEQFAAGKNFTGNDAELLTRCVRVGWLARETFGSTEKAANWFNRPTRAFDGKRPYELLASESGGRRIENLLYSLGYGIAA